MMSKDEIEKFINSLVSEKELSEAEGKNLKKEIEENRFREDLYHRLSVILIPVPPLDERKEDIPLLAEHFLHTICEDHGIPEKKLAAKAVEELQKISWTGNIRELRNVLERLVILSEDSISARDVAQYAHPGQ